MPKQGLYCSGRAVKEAVTETIHLKLDVGEEMITIFKRIRLCCKSSPRLIIQVYGYNNNNNNNNNKCAAS